MTPANERMDYTGTVEHSGRRWVAPKIRPEFRKKIEIIHKEISALNTYAAPFNVLRGSSEIKNAMLKRCWS